MKKNKLKTLDILYYLSIIIVIFSFFRSIGFMSNHVNIDLFNKHLAAKITHSHLDPYHYKWQKDDNKEILNPFDNNDKKNNDVFDSPSILLLNYPFINLNFRILRVIWFFLEWIMLIVSIYLFAKSTSDLQIRRLIFTINFLIFPFSYFWTTHILKGQIYVLFVFLIALAFYAKSKKRYFSSFLSGFIWGFGTLMFPYMIFFFPFTFLSKRYKQTSGFILGFLTNAGISIYLLGINIWINYFDMIKYHLIHNISFNASTSLSYNISDNINSILFKNDLILFDYSLSSISHKFFNYQLDYKVSATLSLIIFFIITVKFFTKKNNYKIDSYLFALICIFLLNLIFPLPYFLYNNLIFIPIISLSFIKIREK